MEDSNYEKVFQEFQKRFLKKNIDETAKRLQLKTITLHIFIASWRYHFALNIHCL